MSLNTSINFYYAICTEYRLILIAAYYTHYFPQYGMTPLILATKGKSEEIISILLNAGADLDLQPEDVSFIIIITFCDPLN